MDQLRDILNVATVIQESTLDRESGFATLLSEINETFLALDPLLVQCSGLLIMFLARTHSAFVASIRLAASGQGPETFMVLRGAIENALYAIHIKHDPEAFDRGNAWLGRHIGIREGSRTRQEFTIANVKESLRRTDEELHRTCQALYDRCLDLGAHPNQRGHFAASQFSDLDNPEGPEFRSYLFTPRGKIVRFALRSCIEVGVFALRVFGFVFEERLKLTAMLTDINVLHRDAMVFCQASISAEPYEETPSG